MSVTAPEIERLLLTRKEAAGALNISVGTLDNYTKAGDIRAVKIGRSVRYNPETLREFIRNLEGK